MKRILLVFVVGLICVRTAVAEEQSGKTQAALTVVQFAPTGEVGSLGEAREIRIIFSEPMVTLGRVPAQVQPGFIRISPAIPGTFRWSGTTILIFTPDARRPLPYATTFKVAVAGAVAVSGRKLAEPVNFAFTTPTVTLAEDGVVPPWQPLRRPSRSRAAIQPAGETSRRAPAHLGPLRTTSLDAARPGRAADTAGPAAPGCSRGSMPRWRPRAQLRPRRTVCSLRSPRTGTRSVFRGRRTSSSSRRRRPFRPRAGSRWRSDPAVPSIAGSATPGKVQDYTVEVERAFFIEQFACTRACEPDFANRLLMRATVRIQEFARATRVTDVTVAGREVDVPRPRAPRANDAFGDKSDEIRFANPGRRWIRRTATGAYVRGQR